MPSNRESRITDQISRNLDRKNRQINSDLFSDLFVAWIGECKNNSTKYTEILNEATGVLFWCPCTNHLNRLFFVGTPEIPETAQHEYSGSNEFDFSTGASVQVNMTGCNAHFFIRNGRIVKI